MAYTPPSGNNVVINIATPVPVSTGGVVAFDMTASEFSGVTVYAERFFLSVTPQSVVNKGSLDVSSFEIVFTPLESGSFLGIQQPVSDSLLLSLQSNSVQNAVSTTVGSFGFVLTLETVTDRMMRITPTTDSLVLSLTLPEPSYWIKVRGGFASPYFFGQTSVVDSIFSLAHTLLEPTYKIRLFTDFGPSTYNLLYRIFTQHLSPYSVRLCISLDSPYLINGTVQAAVDSTYQIQSFDKLHTSVESGYTIKLGAEIRSVYTIVQAVGVRTSFAASYSYGFTVKQEIVNAYAMQDKVRTAITYPYSVLTFIPISAQIRAVYSSYGESVVTNITDKPYVLIDGVRVAIIEGDISAAEGGYAWECSLVLAGINEYARFTRNTQFTVYLLGETFTFIVDGKELERSDVAGLSVKIMGISPTALQSSPRHALTDYIWTTSKQTSEIITEVSTGAATWNLVNWTLPPFRVAYERVTPMDVMQNFAEAVGATVESSKDGAIVFRYLFPVSVPNYATATPSHVFVELTDILSIAEAYAHSPIFNKYRITDGVSENTDTLEWIVDERNVLMGKMRVYPFPWRSTVELIHTGDPVLSIGARTYTEFSTEEFIEIFDGEGSATKPIYIVDQVEWYSADLGGIVHTTDDKALHTTSVVSKNSIVKLRYRTRCFDYPVVTSAPNPTQFLLQNV